MENVGASNLWALRAIIQKAYEQALKELRDDSGFRHDFSKEKPYFELTLRVEYHDFALKLKEKEIGQLKHEINELRHKLKVAEASPIVERIWEFGDDVIAHQKRGGFHRLVNCCRPLPQRVSEWQPRESVVHFEQFAATWDNVEKIPF